MNCGYESASATLLIEILKECARYLMNFEYVFQPVLMDFINKRTVSHYEDIICFFQLFH